MKKMKLFATLAVTAAMVLSLAACGGGSSAAPAASDSGSASTGEAAAPAAGGEKITLIMSQRDEFLSSLEAGAKKAAGELGVAAGDMKVVFVNRVPDDTSILNENAVYVGSDEHTSGKFQGDFLAKYFKDKGQTDIKYILLRGIEGQTSTTLRSESVLKALADNGINATETYAKSCLYDRTEALNQMGNILADSSKEFDCIICNNDAMALGAIEACTQANRTIDFPIVGIDATADGRQAIKDGTLAMSVFQDPNGQGGGAVAAALNLINGAALNEGTNFDVDETGFILWVPFEEVTPDNVADYDNR